MHRASNVWMKRLVQVKYALQDQLWTNSTVDLSDGIQKQDH